MSSVCEAIAAVDGAITAGLEGNLALLAALGANCIIHGALGTSSNALTGCTAGSAALGLVLEAALCIELLLTCGEDEFLAAILANDGLVFVHGCLPHFGNNIFILCRYFRLWTYVPVCQLRAILRRIRCSALSTDFCDTESFAAISV